MSSTVHTPYPRPHHGAGGAYGCGAEPYLLTGDLGHGDRMEYVRFARTPPDTLVGLFGKSESPLYYLDFLSVVCSKDSRRAHLETRLRPDGPPLSGGSL